MLSISSLSKNTANTSYTVFNLHIKALSLQQREKYMKTELSHNKIALYKSIRVKAFKCIYDHLIFRIIFFSLYALLFSPLLTLLLPPNVLSR